MPRITSQTANPDYVLTARLLTEFRNLWAAEFKRAGVDPVIFSRLSVVAMTQLSAMVAVDVGMTVEQFTGVCNVQFTEAYKKAPKFG